MLVLVLALCAAACSRSRSRSDSDAGRAWVVSSSWPAAVDVLGPVPVGGRLGRLELVVGETLLVQVGAALVDGRLLAGELGLVLGALRLDAGLLGLLLGDRSMRMTLGRELAMTGGGLLALRTKALLGALLAATAR